MFSRELTIHAGQTESGVLPFNALRFSDSITFYPPASLAGTVTVEVTHKRGEVKDIDWRTLESDGADVNLSADKALTLVELNFAQLRIKTSVAPGADEVYGIVIQD